MPEHGHSRADRRNLHLHRAALAKLRTDPGLIEPCIALVDAWLGAPEHQAARPYLQRWREMLGTWSVDAIARVVLDESAGQTLRQCSPLGPVLSPRERWALLDEVNREIGSRDPRVL